MWKFEKLRIYAPRFVRFSTSTTLVFDVLSHLHIKLPVLLFSPLVLPACVRFFLRRGMYSSLDFKEEIQPDHGKRI